MKSILKLMAVAPVFAATLSCGGPGGEPLTARSISAVMGGLGQALQKLPSSNTTPSLPVSGVTTSAVGPFAVTCETVSPTTVVDADSDGIAATKSSTFDCTDFASGGERLTRQGSITVTDKNEAVDGVLGGLKVDFNITKFNLVDTSGKLFENSYVGHWEYTGGSGGQVSSTADFSGLVRYESSSFSNNYTYNYTWIWSLTPTDAGNPWAAGQVSVSGAFVLSGDFVYEDSNGNRSQQNGSFAINYYSQNLKYDTTCAKFYQSGSFFVSDGNGTLMEIRYACSTAKFYVNAVESTLYTP